LELTTCTWELTFCDGVEHFVLIVTFDETQSGNTELESAVITGFILAVFGTWEVELTVPEVTGTEVIVMDTGGEVLILALLLAVQVCEMAVTGCIVTLVTGPWDAGCIAANFLTGAGFFGFKLQH